MKYLLRACEQLQTRFLLVALGEMCFEGTGVVKKGVSGDDAR